MWTMSSGNARRSSGSSACPAANAWRVTWDPQFAVTAGQQLEVGIIADNTTASFGRQAVSAGAVSTLPTNFSVVPGGASPKLFAQATLGSFAAPSTIAEASMVSIFSSVVIIGRIA
jgi:hypothetical protein